MHICNIPVMAWSIKLKLSESVGGSSGSQVLNQGEGGQVGTAKNVFFF